MGAGANVARPAPTHAKAAWSGAQPIGNGVPIWSRGRAGLLRPSRVETCRSPFHAQDGGSDETAVTVDVVAFPLAGADGSPGITAVVGCRVVIEGMT